MKVAAIPDQMSTYYHFRCLKCGQDGGFFSRQAWGWGNFDIIDSFKFLAVHVQNCGCEYLRIVSEHDADDEIPDVNMTDEPIRRAFLEEAKGCFPHSDDWGFTEKHLSESDRIWTEQQIQNWKEEMELAEAAAAKPKNRISRITSY